MVVIVLVGIVGGGIYGYQRVVGSTQQTASDAKSNYTVATIPLGQLAKNSELALDPSGSLSINGQLKINNSVVLKPTAEPASGVAGQLYYDQTGNELRYYNGNAYVSVLDGDAKTTIGGQSGNISLGTGLVLAGSKLSATATSGSTTTVINQTGVSSLQGQTGAVTLSAGGGISISGTTITNAGVTSVGGFTGSLTVGGGLAVAGGAVRNTGVLSLTSNTSTLVIANDGNGNLTITDNLNPGGSSTGAVNLAPTSAQSDSSNNAAINVVKTGTGNLLQFATGSTPTDRFVVNNAGAIITGTIGFNQITSAPNFVNTIDGQSGAFTLGSGLSRSGQSLINAGVTALTGTAGQVGVSSSTGAITLSLAQSIATSSSPTFAALTLTSPLALTSGGTGATTQSGARSALAAAASGANSDLTSLSAVTSVGSTGQALALQGSTATTLSATAAGSTTTVGFATPGANVTYLFQSAASGTYSVCTTAGNCAGTGGGVTTAGGTTGTIAKFSSSQGLTNSLLSESGSTVTVNGSFAVNTITPTAALTIGATSQNLALQGSTVSLTSTAGGFTNTLAFATPSGSSKTVTLPNASGTVVVAASGPLSIDASGTISCSSCVSSGGSVGSAGVASLNGLTNTVLLQGTSNQIAVATDSGTRTLTLSLPQSIATTSSPTFSGLTLTSLAVSGAATTGSLAVSGAVTAGTLNGLTLTAATTGFTVAGGTTSKQLTVVTDVTLNQNLASTSTPTFGTVTLTSALAVGSGGTGVNAAPTNGQLLVGNGTGFTLATLTGGSGITVTNSSGGISIASSGGGGSYVNLQSTTPGTPQTGNINISGTIIGSSLNVTGAISGASLAVTGALTAGTVNGLALAQVSNGFTVSGGTSTTSTLTVGANLTVAAAATIDQNLSIASSPQFTMVSVGTTSTLGRLRLTDGTSSGFYATLTPAGSLTASRTYSLPNASGTVCLDSGNCGVTAGSGNYIQNQTAVAQAAGFNINGTATSAAVTTKTLTIDGTAALANATQLTIARSTSGANSAPAILITRGGASVLGLTSDDPSNAFIGLNAGSSNATNGSSAGIDNTYVGASAGYTNSTGTNNTALGYNAGNKDSGNSFVTGTNLQNATSIGAYAQVQASNNIILGSVDTQTSIGIGTTIAQGLFNVSPVDTSGGLATRTSGSAAIVGLSTSWTSSMVGDTLIFSDGVSGKVASVPDSTHLTLTATVSAASASNSSYRLHKTGFEVTATGDTLVQTNSATAFQVQTSSGTGFLTADTTNSRVVVASGGTAVGSLYVGTTLPATPVSTTSTGASSSPVNIVVHGNYAYVIDSTGGSLVIMDISNPTAPVIVGTTSVSNPASIAVEGNYVYIGQGAFAGMSIFDVSNPASPTLVGSLTTGAYNYGISVAGHYVYMSDYSNNNLTVIDVSNPTSPTITGQVTIGSHPYGVTTQGNYVYVASGAGGGVSIVSITNPASPTVVASTTSNSYYEAVPQGRYLYEVGNYRLDVVNIANPNSPTTVSTNSLTVTGRHATAQGRYLYLASGSDTLIVYDISNPASLVFVNSITIASGANVYAAAVQGRYVYTANTGTHNMSTIDLGGAYVQQFEAGSVQTGSLTVQTGAVINGTLNVLTGAAIANGLGVSGGLAVTGTTSLIGAITIKGHIITAGTAPTIAAGAAACTTPTVSVTGNDTAGKVTITTGTGCSASGILATLTFASAYATAPYVTVTPTSAAAGALGYYITPGTTTLVLNATATATSSTSYTYNYHIFQ